MSNPQIMLGGIPIVLHAGAPELSEEAIGGSTLLRLSNGTGIPTTHWEKMAGSISGQGWMPPGLDGLDYSQPLELRTTQVNTMQGTGLVYTLTGTPRPDVQPWAFALVGNDWRPTPCGTVDDVVIVDGEDTAIYVATVTAVAGATAYQVWWMPVYTVKAQRPPKQQSSASATHSWVIAWEEI